MLGLFCGEADEQDGGARATTNLLAGVGYALLRRLAHGHKGTPSTSIATALHAQHHRTDGARPRGAPVARMGAPARHEFNAT